MARKPTKPKPVETEAKTVDAPETASAVRPKATKSAAAREALARGYETPEAAVAFIKSHFGINLGRQHFSAIKSQFLKKQRDSAGGVKTRAYTRRTPAIEGFLAAPTKNEADLLRAMETMKPLIAALGADKVKRIVDLLG